MYSTLDEDDPDVQKGSLICSPSLAGSALRDSPDLGPDTINFFFFVIYDLGLVLSI